uniref:Uncharacterized protein LOC114325046 isoform X4 n=1 Tax=Diabrotica virgifera virgifera TaxID=50390 RepID=A0A6P7EZQ2_DIAVI
MNHNNNMLQLCRLCLVKDEVNIPIFEEQGDIRQIFLKISSCLPVKVSRDDQLPKKICDGCSYKLDMLYEFWNTSANAEKQLLTWLGEAGMTSQMTDGTISAVAQQIKPADAFVKQETIDPPDILKDDDDEDEEDKDYMKQEESSNNVEEPPPKRARRTAAVKAAIALDQNSDDDDDSGEPMTKVEDDTDDSDNDDGPPFVDVPSTSADDQPGPSGVGKDGVEAPQSCEGIRGPSSEDIREPSSEDIKEQSNVDIGEPNGEDIKEPNSEDIGEPNSEGIKEPSSEDIGEPNSEDFKEPSSEDIKETSSEDIKEPSSEVIREPNSEDIKETSCEDISEPDSENIKEQSSEDIKEPCSEDIEEPSSEDIEDPSCEDIRDEVLKKYSCLRSAYVDVVDLKHDPTINLKFYLENRTWMEPAVDQEYRTWEPEPDHESNDRKKTHTCYVCMLKFFTVEDLEIHKYIHWESDESQVEDENYKRKKYTKRKVVPSVPKNVPVESSHSKVTAQKDLKADKDINIEQTEGTAVVANAEATGEKDKAAECATPNPKPVLDEAALALAKKMPYHCETCPAFFDGLEGLEGHNSCAFVCQKCKRKFKTHRGMSLHIMEHILNKGQVFKCTMCSKTFDHALAHKKHIWAHNKNKRRKNKKEQKVIPKKEYTCELCFDVFRTKKLMIIHKRLHREIKLKKIAENKEIKEVSIKIKEEKNDDNGVSILQGNYTVKPVVKKIKIPPIPKVPKVKKLVIKKRPLQNAAAALKIPEAMQAISNILLNRQPPVFPANNIFTPIVPRPPNATATIDNNPTDSFSLEVQKTGAISYEVSYKDSQQANLKSSLQMNPPVQLNPPVRINAPVQLNPRVQLNTPVQINPPVQLNPAVVTKDWKQEQFDKFRAQVPGLTLNQPAASKEWKPMNKTLDMQSSNTSYPYPNVTISTHKAATSFSASQLAAAASSNAQMRSGYGTNNYNRAYHTNTGAIVDPVKPKPAASPYGYGNYTNINVNYIQGNYNTGCNQQSNPYKEAAYYNNSTISQTSTSNYSNTNYNTNYPSYTAASSYSNYNNTYSQQNVMQQKQHQYQVNTPVKPVAQSPVGVNHFKQNITVDNSPGMFNVQIATSLTSPVATNTQRAPPAITPAQSQANMYGYGTTEQAVSSHTQFSKNLPDRAASTRPASTMSQANEAAVESNNETFEDQDFISLNQFEQLCKNKAMKDQKAHSEKQPTFTEKQPTFSSNALDKLFETDDSISDLLNSNDLFDATKVKVENTEDNSQSKNRFLNELLSKGSDKVAECPKAAENIAVPELAAAKSVDISLSSLLSDDFRQIKKEVVTDNI